MRGAERIEAAKRIRAAEDRRVLDILEMISKCGECLGDAPGGVVFGCGKCLEHLARQVMET